MSAAPSDDNIVRQLSSDSVLVDVAGLARPSRHRPQLVWRTLATHLTLTLAVSRMRVLAGLARHDAVGQTRAHSSANK